MEKIEPYVIKEIGNRQNHMFVDIDHFSDLIPFIKKTGTSVWLLERREYQHVWKTSRRESSSSDCSPIEMIRNVSYEVFFSNQVFISLLDNWREELHIVLTNKIPPYYIDSSRANSSCWPLLLSEKLEYTAELYIPGNLDYGWIISPSKAILDELISFRENQKNK